MLVSSAKNWLVGLWFSVCALLITLIVVQSLLGHFGDHVADAWKAFLPNVMPTLGLMISVIVADNGATSRSARRIGGLLFAIAFGLSIFYLLLLLTLLLLQPFSQLAPIELMQQSQQLWLAPLQGLVAGSLGAIFVKP